MNRFTRLISAVSIGIVSLTLGLAGITEAAPARAASGDVSKMGNLDFSKAEPINEVPISAAQFGENCRNIGNGDVCIRIGDIHDHRADVTVWFDKHAGDPVSVRLRYNADAANGEDDGPFTISAGQVRGYIWRNHLITDSCYYGQLRTGPPSYMTLIYGGVVCV